MEIECSASLRRIERARLWPFKVKNWSTIAGTIHSFTIALIKASFGSDGILNSNRGGLYSATVAPGTNTPPICRSSDPLSP